MRGINRIAVEEVVIPVPASKAERGGRCCVRATATFEVPLALHGDERTIHGRFESSHRLIAESGIFRMVNIEAHGAVFAVPQIIPSAVLHLDILIRTMNGRFFQLPKLLLQIIQGIGTFECPHLRFVLLLRELLIQVTVLFVPQITAEATVLDSDAIEKE